MLVGKTCKLGENDQKAKIYLQKIIQSRNSVIHYSETKNNRFLKDYK